MCSNSPKCPAYVGHGNDKCFCGVDGYCRQVYDCDYCSLYCECKEVLQNTILRIKYLLKGGDFNAS